MSAPLATRVTREAIVAVLAADATLAGLVAPAPTTVGGGPGIYGGRAPQGAAKPFLVVEIGDEFSANTLGPPDAEKFGARVTLVIRSVSQTFRDEPGMLILERVKVLLDEQPLTVAGFLSVCSEFETLLPVLVTVAGGVEIREHLMTWNVYLHQGPR
jgi:hypothetical protein